MKLKITTILASTATLISLSINAASFDELAQQQSADRQIIDCRDSNYFNGWPEHQGERGGHLLSAVNISSHWLHDMSALDKQKLIDQRQLTPEKTTYLYGSEAETKAVKDSLSEMGFNDIQILDLPVSQYPEELVQLDNFSKLVSTQWLGSLQHGESVPYPPNRSWVVIEVGYGAPLKYLMGHIPGALYLNTNDIESQPYWNRVSPDNLENLFESLGVRYDTSVILYGRETMAAARAANLMMYAGVKDVRLLNGGYGAWKSQGLEIQHIPKQPQAVADFGVFLPANPELVIDTPQAKSLLVDQQGSSLVSIRSWPEYTGKTSGYDFIDAAGRIRGARWGHAGSDPHHMQDFHNPDGTMKSEEIISSFWSDWNIKKDQNVAFYCGTGWRASEAFFYAYVMGWPNISVYDGGWLEWSLDSSDSVATGNISPK